LSDGAIDGIGLVAHLDGDGGIGDGSQLDGAGGVAQLALQADGRSGGLRRRIALLIDHVDRAVQFLLGDEQRGIDAEGFLEFGRSFFQFAGIAQFLAAVHDGCRGLEANALEAGAVAEILGLKVISLLIEVVGLDEVLASLRVLTFGVQGFGFVGDSGERYYRDQQQEKCRAHQASHSIILTR